MNILVFSENLYPHGGGAELATWLYLRKLSERGFKIKVITRKPPREPSYEKIHKNLEVFRMSLKGPRNIMDSRYYTVTNVGVTYSSFVRKLVRWADVVYIPGSWYTITPLARMCEKPVVVHLHNYSIVSSSSVVLANSICGKSAIQNFMCQEISKRGILGALVSTFLSELVGKYINMMGTLADIIICVSKRQAEIVIRHKPYLAEKIKVIYNPLPEIEPPSKDPSEKPTLMYVGGESYLKGFHVLLKALSILRKKGYTNFELVMTNRYNRDSLRLIERFRSCGINIRVLGRIEYNDLIDLQSRAWALVFPSVWEEPLPYAVIEAMLLGTIPIASRVGGVIELVEGTIAEKFVFPPMDEEELARKMEHLIMMDEKQIRLFSSELKRSIQTKLDTERTVNELAKVFRDLVNR